jgi:thioredoxin reductase (NADPH)
MKKMIYDVIIVGSGPAGYTAAIYTSRALLKTLIVTGYSIGGQLMTTTDIENFPGYTNGVPGPKMMADLKSQAERFGAVCLHRNVTDINSSQNPFKITIDNNTVIQSKAVIIATGAEALWLNLEGENKLRSRGISTCATCDGAFFKDEQLLVIGGGDSAMEEAIFLTKYASKVTIIHRREDFRASKIMLERARKNPKIEWLTSTIVKKWISSEFGDLSGAILDTNGKEFQIDCSGAFIAIGHRPVTNFLNGQVELDSEGYIVLAEHTMTTVPGIFACGDVTDKRYKQAITAAGQGCQAAIDAEKWLSEHV